MEQDTKKQQNIDKHPSGKMSVGDNHTAQNVYEYIWQKICPDEELDYDRFYDWASENSNKALELAFEYCDLNGL